MKRTLTALATVAVLALGTTVATTKSADAHCGLGCGVAIGVGTAALLGAAAAHSAPAYGPGYYGGPVAYGGCYWKRERFFDGWHWHSRRVRVCY